MKIFFINPLEQRITKEGKIVSNYSVFRADDNKDCYWAVQPKDSQRISQKVASETEAYALYLSIEELEEYIKFLEKGLKALKETSKPIYLLKEEKWVKE